MDARTQEASDDDDDTSSIATVFATDLTLEQMCTIGTTSNGEDAKFEFMHCVMMPILSNLVEQNQLAKVVPLIEKLAVEKQTRCMDIIIFALAFCSRADDVVVRQSAFAAVQTICTTPAMLYQFAGFSKTMHSTKVNGRSMGRGQGRGFRRAIRTWFMNQTPYDLIYNITKGGNRHNWSARDLVRVAHISTRKCSTAMALALQWIVHPEKAVRTQPFKSQTHDYARLADFITALTFLRTQCRELSPPVLERVVAIMRTHNLTREHLPMHFLAQPTIWAVLVERMPFTTLLNNLGTLSKHQLLQKGTATGTHVTARLRDKNVLRASDLHPMTVLTALLQYEVGCAYQSSARWDVEEHVVEALNEAMDYTFLQEITLDPDNPIMIGLDISNSMQARLPGLSTSMGNAAAALTTTILRKTKDSTVLAFVNQGTLLKIGTDPTFYKVKAGTVGFEVSRTNCALPMIIAMEQRIVASAFVVITDTVKNCGTISCGQALRAYNDEMGLVGKQKAKLIVLSMAEEKFTIAEEGNPDMLDIVGFDRSSSTRIFEFIRGKSPIVA
jgi:60 kDa SS-A/Ro ribonucleoprotein